MIELKNITKENWFKCTQLQITGEQKKNFPAAPVYWLAECRYMSDWHEYAIYNDDELIGFTVYGFDPDVNEYEIYAVMIDKSHQGKGYGKTAMYRLIEKIKTKHNRSKLYICHREANIVAAKLYESLDFKDTGIRYNGEIIRCKYL